MAIWTVPDPASEPSIRLVRWRIFETERAERHFVGFDELNREGRVSSAIRSFDPATRRGTTSSGRAYELLGEPGHDDDARYVWNAWALLNHVPYARDVTAEMLRP